MSASLPDGGARDAAPAARRRALGRATAVAGVLCAAFALQAHFVVAYPQPPLFGDPAGYHAVGLRLRGAAALLAQGAGAQAAFESVRGVLYFAGAGAVFGLFDALRPGDLTFLRLVFAGFNTLSMLAGFVLARRLSGGFAGGLAALVLLAWHPSFAVETAKLFPDPVTGCLFAWSAVAYLEALERRRARFGVLAGLALGAGLLVRSQLMSYVLVLLPAACALGLWAGRRVRFTRSLVLALLLGVAPFAALWGAILAGVGDDVHEIEALGNFTFKARYPYGFWQFLDSDGWMGPYRLRGEPYYEALEAAARQERWPLDSRPHQAAFTLRYVAARPLDSLLLVLDNAYRLYDRPPNRYKWDYPFPYAAQVAFHRALLFTALFGLALFAARRPARLGVLFVPACLALLHGLSYPWPRFAQPVLPILLAPAGALLGCVLARQARPRFSAGTRARVLALGLGAGLLFASGLALRDALPELARGARLAGTLAGLGLPFAALARLEAPGIPRSRARRMAACTWLVLAGGLCAHALRSPAWHRVDTTVGGEIAGVEQEIALSPQARTRLRAAGEAYVVIDMQPPEGDARGLVVEVGGRAFPGSALEPTLPRLGEFTLEGGPARGRFAQWWALRVPGDLAAGADTLRVRVRGEPGRPFVVSGDRFGAQQRVYDGPSFGEWPHAAGIKFDYDGDCRLPVRVPLASAGTRSFALRRDGGRGALRGVHRVRVLVLASERGGTAWQSAPVPRAARVALGFRAAYGTRGQAELALDGRALLALPLGGRDDYEVEAPPFALCHRSRARPHGPARGVFFLSGPFAAGRPAELSVSFRAGPSDERMFFVVSADGAQAPSAEEAAACPATLGLPLADGAARVIDATRSRYPQQTGRWSVAAVY